MIESSSLASTEGIVPGHDAPLSRKVRDLLCSLAYLHLSCGNHHDAVSLLRMIEPSFSDDVGLLRLLGYALIKDEQADAALECLERLAGLDSEPSAECFLSLLRSHALMLSGRDEEARTHFQHYLQTRTDTPASAERIARQRS